MDNKLITGIIGVVVVVALLGSALVPVIDGLTEGEKTTNEGAGWIRMDYVTGANYDAHASIDAQGNVVVEYGTTGQGILDTQTHAADEDTILFASSELTMWLQDGVINILGKDADGYAFTEQITESGPIANVLKEGTGSQFWIDTDIPTQLSVSSWAYVPKSSGNFAFFDAGTPVDMKNYPVAAVGGGNVGVYGYDNILTYDGLGLQLQPEYDDDGKLVGAIWARVSAADALNTMDFDPSTITIQPLDPSVIDPIDLGGGAQLMSVPTPTYTDGDWGYDLMTVDDVQYAKIVSYSGAGGDNLVIPATVGNYQVYQVGKGGSSNTVFNTSLVVNGLTISEGIKVIDSQAFYNCSNVKGQLILPESLESLGGFASTSISGSLTIPSNVKTITSSAFNSCSSLNGDLIIKTKVLETVGTNAFKNVPAKGNIILPDTVTSLGNSAFYNMFYTGGTVVVPVSVTSLGTNVFSSNASKAAIIASDAVPGSGTYSFDGSKIKEVLILTDAISPGNGIPAWTGATFYDSIGDCLGYVSFVEIGTDAELSGGAAALLIAVPVVVIAGLLVAFVGYSIVKRY